MVAAIRLPISFLSIQNLFLQRGDDLEHIDGQRPILRGCCPLGKSLPAGFILPKEFQSIVVLYLAAPPFDSKAIRASEWAVLSVQLYLTSSISL